MISKQEFLLGAASSIIPAVRLGWWGVGLVVLTATLWPIGGSYWKPARRYGVPLAVVGAAIAVLGFHWWYLISLLGFLPLLLGDGYPSTQPYDSGSWLGQEVYSWGWLSDEVGGLVTKLIPLALLQIFWIPLFVKV